MISSVMSFAMNEYQGKQTIQNIFRKHVHCTKEHFRTLVSPWQAAKQESPAPQPSHSS